jgi:hypothetical protein
MTAPVPEQNDEPIATSGMRARPHEHDSDLPSGDDAATSSGEQEENAGTSLDEPSDDTGRESEASDE